MKNERGLTIAAKPIAILLLILVAVQPLLGSKLPWSDDGQLHFWRVVELDHCLHNGYFYPRWMPDMAYGYGYPLLNYYAPLSVYLAEGFHLLGLDFTVALLAALSASLAIGALGAYLWVRDAFGDTGGLIAAIAYTYAPYTLYNAVWRGNLAESLALGILPWIFWRLRQLALNPDRQNLALATFAFAALILSHNIVALTASPLLAGYVLLLWLTTGRSRKGLSLNVGALILGLILSAFFWLPAFFERDLVQTEKMVTTSHFDYRHNFLRTSELLSPPIPADMTLMNPPVPRSLGWPSLALALCGLAGTWKFKSALPTFQASRCRWETLTAFAFLLLCTLLTLPTSRFLWNTVPLLPYIGFPWRFLGPAGLMAAWLGGASAPWGRGWRSSLRALGVGLAVLLTIGFSLTWLYPRYLEPTEATTPAGLIAFEQRSGALGTTSVGEYLPASVKQLPDTTALEAQYRAGGAIHRLASESLPEAATIVSEQWQLIGGDVKVDCPHDWTATLLLFHFPGWRVWVNDTEVETGPSSPHGLIHFSVPAGKAHIKIRFGSTPWRLAGVALSLAGLAALGWMAMSRVPRQAQLLASDRHIRKGKEHFVWLAALGTVGLIFVAKTSYLDNHDSAVRYTGFDGQSIAGVGAPAQVRFDGGIRLLGHDPARLAVEAGHTLPLRLYWTADAPPGEEYSSFLHLVDTEGHQWGQSNNQHPGGYPTARWRPGEYNRDNHDLEVLPGTPPGTYTLRAGLIDRTTGVSLDVLDERGAPAGTSTAIGAVTVMRPPQAPLVEALDIVNRLNARFGDLTLLSAGLDRHQAIPGETLLLTLYWQAERKPEQDYVASAEITDNSGQVMAQRDLPPAASAYPTSRWIAGEIVQGQHWLTLPVSLDSGTYTLGLQLVGATGKAVGAPVALGEAGQVEVFAPERLTAIPPMAHRLDVNFGDLTTLLGYDLAPDTARASDPVRLTLYWRAEQPMTRSYAVFAHLLDAKSLIVAQHDGLPVNWTRPTTSWLPGEIIADTHELVWETAIPPGKYALEVGLYDPQTNVRLPVLDAAGHIIEYRALLAPIAVEP